jgi:hypothetical protein
MVGEGGGPRRAVKASVLIVVDLRLLLCCR